MSSTNREWFLKFQKTEPGERPTPPRQISLTSKNLFVEEVVQTSENELENDYNNEILEEEALLYLYSRSPHKHATRTLVKVFEHLIIRSFDKNGDVCDSAISDYSRVLHDGRTFTEALMKVDDESIDARHMWDELRKIHRIISALLAAKGDEQEQMKIVSGLSHTFSLYTGSIIGHLLGVQRDLSIKRGKAGKLGAKVKRSDAKKWREKAKPLVKEILKERNKKGQSHTARSAAERLKEICRDRKAPEEHISIPGTTNLIAEWIRDDVCRDNPGALRQTGNSRSRKPSEEG